MFNQLSCPFRMQQYLTAPEQLSLDGVELALTKELKVLNGLDALNSKCTVMKSAIFIMKAKYWRTCCVPDGRIKNVMRCAVTVEAHLSSAIHRSVLFLGVKSVTRLSILAFTYEYHIIQTGFDVFYEQTLISFGFQF